ncbi:MAG TPA: hypothetical protein VFF09_01580 [archaeon]|nr:hypothetical protein [archaeon]
MGAKNRKKFEIPRVHETIQRTVTLGGRNICFTNSKKIGIEIGGQPNPFPRDGELRKLVIGLLGKRAPEYSFLE